jgi:hypothetical protein
MKTTFLKLLSVSFIFLFVVGLIVSPLSGVAQDAEKDTVEAVQDNSSAFNDSVQFDDMEPIFYEAADDEVEPAIEEGSGIMLYVGIAVVLVIILIVLKKVGGKKKS